MIGNKFNKLTIIECCEPFIQPSGQKNKAFICKCDCVNVKKIRYSHLKNGKIKSCGCILKTKNGKGSDKLCKVWRQMKSRCSSNYFQKHLYFDKGILVCDIWLNDYFEFEKWSLLNGYKEGLVIDRKDGNKGYNPDNCRWISQLNNSLNKVNTFLIKYNGNEVPLMEVLTEKKIRNHYNTILNRIKRGWNHEEAVNKPIRIGNYKTSKSKEEIEVNNNLMLNKLKNK